MRAVNLIPAEERRARSGAGRSGGGVHVVLGVLALALVLLTAQTVTKATLTEKRSELAAAKADTVAAQRQVDDLRAYTTFAALREKRVATIGSLVASRFDWAHALREVARTVPAGAWLSGLRGTVNPSVNVEGAAADALRGALAVPAIEMKGCSTGQKAVALLVGDLRRIDGVDRVSLSESVKEEAGAAGVAVAVTAAAAPGGDATARVDPCATNGRAKFSLTVFFRTAPTVAAPVPGPAGAAPTTVSTGATTP